MSTPIKRRPDALRVPRAALQLRPNEDPDVKIKQLFAPVLGSPRVYRRDIHHGEEKLLTADVDPMKTSLYFPNGHPHQGDHRYEWFIAEKLPDGTYVPGIEEEGAPDAASRIKLGYAKPDPFADDEAVQASVAADYQRRLREAWSDPAWHRNLLAKGVIDKTEYVERLKHLGFGVDGQGNPVPVAPKPVPDAVLAGQAVATPEAPDEHGPPAPPPG